VTKVICKRFPCEVCGKTDLTQVFLRSDGTPKYARARHYIGKKGGKPQFNYHQQSLGYLQRKLNEMQNEDKPINTTAGQVVGQIGQGKGFETIDPQLRGCATIQQNKAWTSSSVRIEHQPPKLGVEGSNPSSPATKLNLELKSNPACSMDLLQELDKGQYCDHYLIVLQVSKWRISALLMNVKIFIYSKMPCPSIREFAIFPKKNLNTGDYCPIAKNFTWESVVLDFHSFTLRVLDPQSGQLWIQSTPINCSWND
jgi:hypothetical protein